MVKPIIYITDCPNLWKQYHILMYWLFMTVTNVVITFRKAVVNFVFISKSNLYIFKDVFIWLGNWNKPQNHEVILRHSEYWDFLMIRIGHTVIWVFIKSFTSAHLPNWIYYERAKREKIQIYYYIPYFNLKTIF